MRSLLCPTCRGRLVRVWAPDPVGARLTMRCEKCNYATHDAVVERRRAPRRPAVFPIVLAFQGEKRPGKTKDVSATGVAVQIEGPPPAPGTAVRLEVAFGDDHLELAGRVAWARADEANESGEVGIAFDPLRVQPRALESLLEAERRKSSPE